jgi:nucleoside-diphosphate-sugar epimerase
MTVAITGGTGFIGSTLVRRLSVEGYNIRLLIRQPDVGQSLPSGVEVFPGALDSTTETLRTFLHGVDVLYHCAAEIYDASKMVSTNVEGTRNLALAAAHTVRHWVQLSSIDTFGTQTVGVITETSPRGKLNLYEETKIIAEQVVAQLAVSGGYSYSILRPSKVYGPEMRNQLLYKLISLIDRGHFFFIGRPGASANYVHVDDVVAGLILCGSHARARNRDYNLSNYCSLEELVTIIASTLDRPTPRWRIAEGLTRTLAMMTCFVPNNPLTPMRVNALVKRARYSTVRIETELGYSNGVSMKAGVQQLVHKWQENVR